jgi:hypothetical protein
MNATGIEAVYAQPAQPYVAQGQPAMYAGSPVQNMPYQYAATNASAPPQYPENQSSMNGEQPSQPAPIVHHI